MRFLEWLRSYSKVDCNFVCVNELVLRCFKGTHPQETHVFTPKNCFLDLDVQLNQLNNKKQHVETTVETLSVLRRGDLGLHCFVPLPTRERSRRSRSGEAVPSLSSVINSGSAKPCIFYKCLFPPSLFSAVCAHQRKWSNTTSCAHGMFSVNRPCSSLRATALCLVSRVWVPPTPLSI